VNRIHYWCVAIAVALTGCPRLGVECQEGTVECGTGCIDPASDRRNCGACGLSCLDQQDCNAGTCACRVGTINCGGVCVVTEYEPKFCAPASANQCGTACASGEVCELGACKVACSTGFTRCGTGSCVNTASDAANCGACGTACQQGQRCVGGLCEYSAVAACLTGQIVGFDIDTGVKGTLSPIASSAAALARLDNSVLVADFKAERLYSAAPGGASTFVASNRVTRIGSVPNQILVDRPYVYVVNAGAGTLQVLKEGVETGTQVLDSGTAGALVLGTVAELQLGMNSFPQGVAKIGSTLYVPLYGGSTSETADAGQAVAKINVTDPAMPALSGLISLKDINLQAFDGGAPVPRPFAIVEKGGQVYVVLNNLNADTYAPEGPGLVAKINPATDGVSVIAFEPSQCLNPVFASAMGEKLIVSCGGRPVYEIPSYALLATEAAGIMVIDGQDNVIGHWSTAALADAGAPVFSAGRFGVLGNKIALADQNGGRVAVLSFSDAGITEVRNGPICPLNETNLIGNVAEVSTRR
jgi:hypothetical protein